MHRALRVVCLGAVQVSSECQVRCVQTLVASVVFARAGWLDVGCWLAGGPRCGLCCPGVHGAAVARGAWIRVIGWCRVVRGSFKGAGDAFCVCHHVLLPIDCRHECRCCRLKCGGQGCHNCKLCQPPIGALDHIPQVRELARV